MLESLYTDCIDRCLRTNRINKYTENHTYLFVCTYTSNNDLVVPDHPKVLCHPTSIKKRESFNQEESDYLLDLDPDLPGVFARAQHYNHENNHHQVF